MEEKHSLLLFLAQDISGLYHPSRVWLGIYSFWKRGILGKIRASFGTFLYPFEAADFFQFLICSPLVTVIEATIPKFRVTRFSALAPDGQKGVPKIAQ